MKPLTHGKTSTYTYHNCRCALCKKAIAEYMQKWRLKTGQVKPMELHPTEADAGTCLFCRHTAFLVNGEWYCSCRKPKTD